MDCGSVANSRQLLQDCNQDIGTAILIAIFTIQLNCDEIATDCQGIERIAPKSREIHKLQENTSYCPRIGVQLRSVRSQNAISQNPGNPDPTGHRTQSNWIAIGLQNYKGLQGDWPDCIKIAQFASRLQQLRASKRDRSTAIQPIFGHSRTSHAILVQFRLASTILE